MPDSAYDYSKLKDVAAQLRTQLGDYNLAGMSDADVIKHAYSRPEVSQDDKDWMHSQFGESVGASFGKGFARGSMLDTLGDLAVKNSVPGWMNRVRPYLPEAIRPAEIPLPDVRKWTEHAPVQTTANKGARLVGNVGGGVATALVPGVGQAGLVRFAGPAAKLSPKALTALRVALQSGSGANQTFGEQREQIIAGEREGYNPAALALAAATGAAGARADVGLNVTQDRLWKEGIEALGKGGVKVPFGGALKAAWGGPGIGAAVNAAEEGIQGTVEGMIDDQNLTENARAQKMGVPERMLWSGAFGAGADVGGRGLGRLLEGPAQPPGAPPPISPPGRSTTPVTTPGLSARGGATPATVMQKPGALPYEVDLAAEEVKFQDPAFKQGAQQAVLHGSVEAVEQATQDVSQQIARGARPLMAWVMPPTQAGQAPAVMHVWKSANGLMIGKDPFDGTLRRADKRLFDEAHVDAMWWLPKGQTGGVSTSVIAPGSHRRLHSDTNQELVIGGKPHLIVGRKPTTAREPQQVVSAVPLPLQAGKANRAIEHTLDPTVHSAELAAIQAAVEKGRQKKAGTLIQPVRDFRQLPAIAVLEKDALRQATGAMHSAVDPFLAANPAPPPVKPRNGTPPPKPKPTPPPVSGSGGGGTAPAPPTPKPAAPPREDPLQGMSPDQGPPPDWEGTGTTLTPNRPQGPPPPVTEGVAATTPSMQTPVPPDLADAYNQAHTAYARWITQLGLPPHEAIKNLVMKFDPEVIEVMRARKHFSREDLAELAEAQATIPPPIRTRVPKPTVSIQGPAGLGSAVDPGTSLQATPGQAVSRVGGLMEKFAGLERVLPNLNPKQRRALLIELENELKAEQSSTPDEQAALRTAYDNLMARFY